jgi:hypothetical protein
MDFSKLNTREAAEKGAFLHWRHPVTNELLYTPKGEPCRAFMRGAESPTVLKEQRASLKGPKIEDDAKRGLAYISPILVYFENVFDGDRQLTDTQEDKEWFFRLSESFVEQALAFVRDRANFFGQKSAD